ncbi:MAG TPA: hypothetical protein VFM25_05100 [Verrucomicrobiae bacterium]|nr:hypothetical protein [Verrucomicrobiae bacterium]
MVQPDSSEKEKPMKKRLPPAVAELIVVSGFCLLLTGYGATPHAYKITPEDYLNQRDYSELQKVADRKLPLRFSMDLANPLPKGSYHVENGGGFSFFDKVKRPDLVNGEEYDPAFGVVPEKFE